MTLKTLALIGALSVFPTMVIAAGTHDGGHDEYAIGMKAEKAKSKRTINITMREDQDGNMIFEPKKLQFREGETVTLNFVNRGATKHEFVMDTQENVLEHKAVMEKNPDMEHADDNSLSLEPGEKGQIVWTFAKSGDFAFACLIPGHYESGMHGPLKVTAK
jgi:uncharacterized cupredoxin-like copper-binding protein